MFAPLVVLTIWMGVYPSSFLTPMSASVANLVEQYESAISARAVPQTRFAATER